MAKATRVVLSIALVLAGALLLAYPSVSNWLAESSRSEVIADYDKAVESAGAAELSEAFDFARAYNDRLRSGVAAVIDPFDPYAEKVSDAEYEQCLNIAGDGVMGTIRIPTAQIVLPLYHGTDEECLKRGAGHLQGTALPVGGESTHCVIAGHTGLPTAQLFDKLDQVQLGDVFTISVLGRRLAYQVCDIEVVLPEQTDSLVVQEGRDLVTLVTCTPYGKNTHRLLVTGQRCELPQDDDGVASAGDKATEPFRLTPEAVTVFAVLCAVGVGVFAGSASSRRRLARSSLGRGEKREKGRS